MAIAGDEVAEVFDTEQGRQPLRVVFRPEEAEYLPQPGQGPTALAVQLADPGRGWDAIVIGEYERAFYGSLQP